MSETSIKSAWFFPVVMAVFFVAGGAAAAVMTLYGGSEIDRVWLGISDLVDGGMGMVAGVSVMLTGIFLWRKRGTISDLFSGLVLGGAIFACPFFIDLLLRL